MIVKIDPTAQDFIFDGVRAPWFVDKVHDEPDPN
jgi:hypothetical protein